MNNNYLDTLSYTNKDFNSIWPEILDLVKDLTDKWDPNNSNEADPGVALLKLNAFIADKLNYNIDKNILEAFPSSVTQRGNAQKLYESLGYELKWYRSATTEVFFKFANPKDGELGEDSNLVEFNIPRFAQLKDIEGNFIYTLLNKTTIDNKNNAQTNKGIMAIEGSIETFNINGVENINISNLDSNYRLYFNESMIASNGIFINNIGEEEEFWDSTFNLNTSNLNKKVFKFGVLPNTNQCYIEFPQNAAELFGEGINIHYIISSGTRGNITSRKLQEFAQEYSNGGRDENGKAYSLKTYVRVINPNGTNNGEDPESLEQAYINFQRSVNTFSTLVTLKDYQNAIINEGEVSNCIVSDRTTDFNSVCKIKSLTDLGEVDSLLPKEDGLNMNAFNLALYVLNKVPNVYNADTYNSTFKTSVDSQQDAWESIEEYKSVQHDLIDVYNKNLKAFLFKNMIELKGQIYTYQKVSTIEAKDIIDNIKKALYINYQSKNLQFGEDLDPIDIIATVKNADPRIKEFFLLDTIYNTNVMYSNNNSFKILTDDDNNSLKDLRDEIIARSIIAGVTPLFLFDQDFTHSYQMRKPDNIDNCYIDDIAYVRPEVEIKLPNEEGKKEYSLKENENVLIYAPNYISKLKISTYLYSKLESNNANLKLSPNSIYELKEGEYLCISEALTNENGMPSNSNDIDGKNFKRYGPGTIIKPSFNLESNSIINLETDKFIDILEPNLVNLNSNENGSKKQIYCCWITDNKDNRLFNKEDIEYAHNRYEKNYGGENKYLEHILQQNEVFLYTDAAKYDLIILQSGTCIKIPYTKYNVEQFAPTFTSEKPPLSNVNQEGMNSLSDFWKELPNSTDFIIEELQIYSLGKGTTIKYSGDGTLTLKNDPIDLIQDTISWDEGQSLPSIQTSDSNNIGWRACSRLSVFSTSEIPYTLRENQSLKLYTKDGYDKNESKAILEKDHSFITKNILISSNNIVQSTIYVDEEDKEQLQSFLIFENNNIENLWDTSNNISNLDLKIQPRDYEYYETTINLKGDDKAIISLKDLIPPKGKDGGIIIPILINSSTEKATMEFNTSSIENSQNNNIGIKADTPYLIYKYHKYALCFKYEDNNYEGGLQLTLTGDPNQDNSKISIKLYHPCYYNNFNNALGENRQNIMEKVANLASVKNTETINNVTNTYYSNAYNYGYKIPKGEEIINPLDPLAFYNPNHICNNFTISQLGAINISLSRQSMQ